MRVVGIDPAIRHSGLCLLKPAAEPQFRQINTDTSQDIVSSVNHMEKEFTAIFEKMAGKIDVFAMERQLSVGASSSSMQYLAQVVIMRLAWNILKPKYVVLPLPNQITSFARKQLGFTTGSATQVVRSFKEYTGYEGRISQHCVDGWLAAKLAQAVLAGEWKYKLPSKEVQLFPGIITNGGRVHHRSDQQDQEAD